MLSYWEKQSLLHYDCILLGSGIVGLSAAVSIKERYPDKRLLVLERGLLPTGASTRNAGFACIGSLTEILDDLESMSADDVRALVEMRCKGLRRLRARIGDARMQYRENGSYELLDAEESLALQHLHTTNELLAPILPGPAFTIETRMPSAFGFPEEKVKAIIRNNFEGELHTGMMMRSLIDLALEKGIEIKTGCEVKAFEENGGGVRVRVQHPYQQESVTFSAPQLVICTNAFTRQLLPELDVTPGRGQVLITSPVRELPFRGIYHFNKGYYYFREIDGRVLFGGGRNLDFSGEATTSFALNERIQHDLEEKLRTLILPHHSFTIEDRWTGIMGFGKTKRPIVQAFSDRIYIAVRMGGMGVAIGSEVGSMLAEILRD